MQLIDYEKKVSLKLHKKYVGLIDAKYKKEYKAGYDRYFKHVLAVLHKDLTDSLNLITTDPNPSQKKSKLTDNIYVMWWQGLEKAPKLVQNNIKRMQDIFGKENVYIINQKNWKKYCSISDNIIHKFESGKISITALSDIIRFNLLRNTGGLWIDSTVILNGNCKGLISDYNDNNFFSISNQDKDYHYISKSRWTAWMIGGKPSYSLFEFATKFYELYFKRHNFLIDYYTIDDIIAYFYNANSCFKKDVDSISSFWQPYLWSTNMNNKDSKKMIEKFKSDPFYSIQKFTYKYDPSIANRPKTLLHAIIKNKI